MENKVDRSTMVGMITGMIEDSKTVGMLNACDVIVHDVLWTRYSEDVLVRQLKNQINAKRTDIILKIGR